MRKLCFVLFRCGSILFLSFFSTDVRAASFTVDTTADSGHGSLRQAILDANANPGADKIRAFCFPCPACRPSASYRSFRGLPIR